MTTRVTTDMYQSSKKYELPRRPLVYIAAAYISGIAFCYFFSPPFSVSISGLIACSSVLAYQCFSNDSGLLRSRRAWRCAPARNDKLFIIFLCVVFLTGTVYAHMTFTKTDPLEKYMDGGTGYANGIVGRVLFTEQKDVDYRLLTVVTGKSKILVRVYGESGMPMSPPPEDLIGKQVLLRGFLAYPDTARNPGCFNYRLHLLSKDIRLILTCELEGDFRVIASEDAPKVAPANGSGMSGVFEAKQSSALENLLWNTLGALAHAKAAFTVRVNTVLPPAQAALFSGMMFGDKEALDEDTYELFRRHGVAHILSVSGLHIGMVYAFVSAALGSRKTKRFYITVVILLLCYAALSNFSPSVMRAFSMIAVHIGAKLLNRRYDMLTGVLLSALIMLVINPLALFGVGFILSYTAVCSLAFALPFTDRFTGFRNKHSGLAVKDRELEIYGMGLPERFGGKIIKLFIPAVIIQFFMLPLTMYFFNCLPVFAVLINIPVIAFASLIVPFGLVILLIASSGALFPSIAHITDAAAGIGTSSSGFLIDTMLFLTNAADRVSFSSYTVPSPPLPLIFLFFFTSFYLLSDTFAMKKSIWLPALIITSCLFVSATPAAKYNDAAYTFVDVGQGDCLHIKTPDGRNYLMDGGGKYDYDIGKNVLARYLLKNGVNKLDGVFVSHLHMDHFKGISELADIINLSTVYVYEGYSICPEAVTLAFSDDNVYKTAAFTADRLRFLKAGDSVMLGKYVRAEVLYPENDVSSTAVSGLTDFENREMQHSEAEDLITQYIDEKDENKSSLMIRFVNKGVSVLMTGDISKEGEEAAVELSDLSSDILKVGHHGSKTSTSEDFIKSVSPKIAVIQLGKNVYGHPAPETLETLSAANLKIYRNDEDGAVLIYPHTGKTGSGRADVTAGFTVKTVKRDLVPPVLLKPFEKK